MGPRACSFWVEIPTSAPSPSWPPSVKRVEAFTAMAAESTPARNAFAEASDGVQIASVCPLE